MSVNITGSGSKHVTEVQYRLCCLYPAILIQLYWL